MPIDFPARIADRIPSMVAYWDRDLRCRYANRAYRDWFGIEPEALLGQTLPELLGQELYALNEPYVRGALEGREQQFERDVPGPSGVRRSLACYLPDWRDGQVAGFIAYVSDVTSLKQAQDRLRLARQRTAAAARQLRRRAAALREAQRLAQVGSWEWRAEADQATWSPELRRIFGLQPHQAPPPYKEQSAIYLPQSWKALQRAVPLALSEGIPYELELAFRHPDGSIRWIEARGEPLVSGAGRIIGIRGTAHDITLRRQLEEARIRAQVAESASRNKTVLLSRASHELRTPLNAILGFGQLLQDQAALPPMQRKWLELLVESGQHMLALTQDLLDAAAAESGGLSVARQTVDLQAVLLSACDTLEPQARRADIRIERPQAPGRALVRADETRTRQIVMNLLENAIKYGSPGTTVRVSTAEGSAGTVSLHVEDQGPGLTDEQLGLLFRPFERLGAERTPVQGVGLGLVLSRQLAELMGGRIEVRSQPGAGSRFTLVLPAALT